MDFTGKLSFLVFLLCVLFSLKNQHAETNKVSSRNTDDSHSFLRVPSRIKVEKKLTETHSYNSLQGSLRYDYYNESCPLAEKIVRTTVHELFNGRRNVAPALLRLLFHDCFVEGCDASVLLDAADGIASEKDSPPNESLKGFDLIDIIKLKLEQTCPGIVSCADIVVLAARESVLPGRRDSTVSFQEVATYELPTPQDDLSKSIETFASRGFDQRETVSLLGAHSTGTIRCKFFFNRLYNFSGTQGPDPSIDTEFLSFLRSKCNRSHTSTSPLSISPSLSPSPSSSVNHLSTSSFTDPVMKMDYEGPGTGFGTVYYSSLLQGKGLLFVDQQLTAGEETETWVRAYASDVSLFQRDFGLTMTKLSNLQVLTAPMGQVRLNCRKVN
ncbi:Peroxidase superfamily protein [Forsythia ovata]|uniref:Peroxidase n=1 Tax=Forsythia ovata TaxID=205694 RepID=A0ABD1TTV8_9LAMI